MGSGLRGPYDLAFNEKRARIGRVHVRIGLAQQYMFTAVNVVRSAYADQIRVLYPADAAIDVIRSVDKLFDIELALMLRHYQLDSEERLVDRERAIQADRLTSMATLTAGLAHEVRNPLNAAKLQLELLERRLRRQGAELKLVEPAELAHHEIRRLTELLNEFLAFARPPELHAEIHDPYSVIDHVLKLERDLAATRGVSIALVGEPAPMRVDPGKLHQIVQNLVRNAIEAAREQVTVTLESSDDSIRIEIRDDGTGIPDDIRARIFEPFFSTKEGGTGMGMAIVHSFVALHDGKIDVSSSNAGTTIELSLPRHR